MPETGFCLQRIKVHLRKWIGLYVAGMIAVCFLNHIVYTVTRPGFSDDERLKIMLLNVETALTDSAYAALSMQMLPEIQAADEGILILEFEELPAASKGDPTSEMLLAMKLTGGYGDLYLTDEAGLELLRQRNALANDGPVRIKNCVLTGGEAYLTIVANTTDMESARIALPIVSAQLEEKT